MSCAVATGGASAIIAEATKGFHVLTINGYSLTKRLSNGHCIKSDPFNIGGHRWRIRYYPDGYNAEDAGSISFYLSLDHTNATDARASLRFTLVAATGDPDPFYRLSDDDIIRTFTPGDDDGWPGWGFPGFITRKALEESNYLKDDCFSVRCDVTVSMAIHTESRSSPVTVPPADMSNNIGGLLASGLEADITFEVGEETFAAHRLVLGARSSVFMAELFGPMLERSSGNVRVDDMEPRVFKAMLHFIYNDVLPEMDGGHAFAMVQHLLVAADRYGLERLRLMCEHKLCECINTTMVTSTLVLAEQHGCKGLKEACFRFLKSPAHLKSIIDGDEFQHLTSSCPSILSELLGNVCTL